MTMFINLFDHATGFEIEGLPALEPIRQIPAVGERLTIWTDHHDRDKNQRWHFEVIRVEHDFRIFPDDRQDLVQGAALYVKAIEEAAEHRA